MLQSDMSRHCRITRPSRDSRPGTVVASRERPMGWSASSPEVLLGMPPACMLTCLV